jgi:hypothetical protein
MVFLLTFLHFFLFLVQPLLALPHIHLLYFFLFLCIGTLFSMSQNSSSLNKIPKKKEESEKIFGNVLLFRFRSEFLNQIQRLQKSQIYKGVSSIMQILEKKERNRLNYESIRYILYINYGIYVLHILILQVYHYYSFFLTENDVVSITEVILETERGNLFTAHHFGTPDIGNYLAHHFSPILGLFVPFMMVFPYKMTYCGTLVLFSGLGLYLWERILFHLKLPLGLYFLLSLFVLYNSFLYQLFTSYHFESLSFFFFCFLLYGMITEKPYLEGLGVILFLLTKEDMPLYLFLFSTILFFQKKWKRSMIYASVSVLYFLCIQIIQSNLDPSAKVNWISAWGHWGTNTHEILGNLLTSPLEIGKIYWEKRRILQNLLGSFGFLPLLFYQGFGSILAILSLHLLSSREWYNSFYHYYSYPILPSFLYAIVVLAQKFRTDLAFNKTIPVLLLFGSVLYTLKGNREFPQKWGKIDWERVHDTREIQKRIPLNASVHVIFDMGMHLRKDIQVYRMQKDFLKEYILVDRRGMSPYYPIENLNEDIEKVLREKKFLLYSTIGSVKLYKRKEER